MEHINQSVDMLKDIYQTASMGLKGSELLVNKTEDVQFFEKLNEYAASYNDIKNEAATLLSDQGEIPQDGSTMDKAGLWMGVQLNTLKDKTSSHMAEMLIQGSTMGIIESEKQKNRYPDADKKCCKLEDQLLSLQRRQIDDMKEFLG